MKVLLVLTALLAPVLSSRLPYIVGGQDVSPVGKWPWQASLQTFGRHACGAAIISDTWLVTAAHCVERPAFSYSVVLGMHNLKDSSLGDPKTYDIKRIIQHPFWSSDSQTGFANDIALIELSSTIEMNEFVQAVKLAERSDSFLGNSDCWITGWGKTGYLSRIPNVLQEASVDVYSRATCTASFGDVINVNHICVGKRFKSGSCSGDSGGPLVCSLNNEYTLAGVTSFGPTTCSTSMPSVYTRISSYRAWIGRNTGV